VVKTTACARATYGHGVTIGTFNAPSALNVVASSGKVGIGTTTPASTLDVAGTVHSSGIVRIGTTSTTAMLNSVAKSGSVMGLFTAGFNAADNSGSSGSDAIHAAGGSADFFTDGLLGGVGVVASGGFGGLGSNGGAGIIAQGGGGEAGAAGGTFTGGGGVPSTVTALMPRLVALAADMQATSRGT
jgi:hypothetical protein